MAVVILAAGGSTRLGRPKQLAVIGKERLLERAVRSAGEAGCEPIVILGSSAERIAAECSLAGSRVIWNPLWREGMASSIVSGISAAEDSGASAAIIMTCDQPGVTAQHLRRLIQESEGKQEAEYEIVASAYAERRGVPAIFPASRFGLLKNLKGDAGARDLLRQARTVDLPFGEVDVDTLDELRVAEMLWGQEDLF